MSSRHCAWAIHECPGTPLLRNEPDWWAWARSPAASRSSPSWSGAGHRPVRRRRPHGRRHGAGRGGGHRVADHGLLRVALEAGRARSRRHVPLPDAVAAYYRSQFLNTTLPGGVARRRPPRRSARSGRRRRRPRSAGRRLGAHRRAGRAGRAASSCCWCCPRRCGRRCRWWLVVARRGAVGVLLARPGAAAARALAVGAGAARGGATSATGCSRRGAGRQSRWRRWSSSPATRRHSWSPRGPPASRARSMSCCRWPCWCCWRWCCRNVGGWGPREGGAAWAFGAAGLGAALGVATAVVYGVMVLVASLPGALVLVAGWSRRRWLRRSPSRVPVAGSRREPPMR